MRAIIDRICRHLYLSQLTDLDRRSLILQMEIEAASQELHRLEGRRALAQYKLAML